MALRTTLRSGLIVTLYVFVYSSSVFAQSPHRLQRCLSSSDVVSGLPAQPKVIIDAVTFDSPQLPSPIQDEITAPFKEAEFRVGSRWVDGIDEVGVRNTLYDHGYFRARLTTEAKIISTDAAVQHVSLTIHVVEGPQYRMGKIEFHVVKGTTLAFPIEELRKLVPLNEGDLFNVSKIRHGLDELKRLYASIGYIDFVPEPTTMIDDDRHLLTLDIGLDQEKQFHIGRIEITGLDPTLESILRQRIEPGTVFNIQPVRDFYDEYKSALPPDASVADDQLERDVKNAIVDLIFDFRSCSETRLQ